MFVYFPVEIFRNPEFSNKTSNAVIKRELTVIKRELT